MNIHTLTITFAGICTHFRNVVAGVPYRVVLPDCTQFRTGRLTIDNDLTGLPPSTDVPYYIVPHFPSLSGDWDFEAGELISAKGDILQGVRIQVINAIDEGFTGDLDKVRHLQDFVPGYNFASDVVMNGRAACYLDLFGGALSTQEPIPGVIQAVVTIQTRGVPELLVTPLRQSKTSRSYLRGARDHGQSPEVPVELQIRNLETLAETIVADDDSSFDYLLHYLTARGGIPSAIAAKLPGMKPPLASATAQDIQDAMLLSGFSVSGFLLGTAPANPDAEIRRGHIRPREFTPSCSDSQYP